MVSNIAPVNRKPPRRPDPPLTADGRLPVQYPAPQGLAHRPELSPAAA